MRKESLSTLGMLERLVGAGLSRTRLLEGGLAVLDTPAGSLALGDGLLSCCPGLTGDPLGIGQPLCGGVGLGLGGLALLDGLAQERGDAVPLSPGVCRKPGELGRAIPLLPDVRLLVPLTPLALLDGRLRETERVLGIGKLLFALIRDLLGTARLSLRASDQRILYAPFESTFD